MYGVEYHHLNCAESIREFTQKTQSIIDLKYYIVVFIIPVLVRLIDFLVHMFYATIQMHLDKLLDY